jgi:RIO kinase 2
MVKLDVTLLRYLEREDFRVLTAVEMGMKNHELVPAALVTSISSIRDGGVGKVLQNLCRHKLVAYERGKRFDGYRLTYSGYDYIALNCLKNKGVVTRVGNQIGVGKESDVFVATNDEEEERFALKIHRLGRTCFRTVNDKRDYHSRGRKLTNWIYASRLAAAREFAFMKILHEEGFPVPKPIDCNRHCVVMNMLDGVLLNHMTMPDVNDPETLCERLLEMILSLANTFGLVHGDFNEFNIMVLNESQDPILIDFPQMVPVHHKFAQEYFDRDVHCVVDFFRKRFEVVIATESIPTFEKDVDVHGVKERAVVIEGFPVSNLLQEEMDEEATDGENENFEKEDKKEEDKTVTEISIPDKSSSFTNELPNSPPAVKDEDSDEDIISVIRAGSCVSVGSTIPPEEVRSRLQKEFKKKVHKQRLKVASKSVKGDDSAIYRKRKDAASNIKEDLASHALGHF